MQQDPSFGTGPVILCIPLEKQAKSGIIGPNRSKGLSEVEKASVSKKSTLPEDVTKRYLDTATPDSHMVQDLHTYVVNGISYQVDGHNVVLDYSAHEKEIAQLLERLLGGELFMVPRINDPPGVSTPDYLFRGKKFDLKSSSGSGKNTLYDTIAKKSAQAENFIFDMTHSPLSEPEIIRQITLIYTSTHTRFVDVIVIVKNNDIIRIFQRSKQQS